MSEYRPQRYLVRYVHDANLVVVDFLSSVPGAAEDMVYKRVKRLAETYRFCAVETARGDLVSAQFLLLDKFFWLERAPSSLALDMGWLALETGVKGIASIDPWWVAIIGCALLPEDDESAEGAND